MPTPPVSRTIPALLRAGVEQFGDMDLIVTPERRITYAEADRASAELAKGLLVAGVGKGTRVGVLAPNGVEWLVSWLAAARIGALTVPVNTFYQPVELRDTLRHADVAMLLMSPRVGDHDLVGRVESSAPELAGLEAQPLFLPSLPMLRHVWIWGRVDHAWARSVDELKGSVVDDALLDAVEAEVVESDLLACIYTSGSTARPKGVLHTHGTLLRHTGRPTYRGTVLHPGDRVYSSMPLFWVGGMANNLLAAMHAGAALLCDELFDPARALDFITQEHATLIQLWPKAKKDLYAQPGFEERVPAKVRNRFTPRPGALGMTETCGPHTTGPPSGPDADRYAGSYGTAVTGVEHRIVDPETGAVMPDDEAGELCVRGEDVFVDLMKVERDLTFDRDGWYHTGDRASLRDGQLFFTGRLTDMIKTNGMNVAPPEVEMALETVPGVRLAAVIGLPSADLGQEVAAAVVPQGDVAVEPEGIRVQAKERLAAYKVPRRIIVLGESSMPTLSSGKIDKRALRALFEVEERA